MTLIFNMVICALKVIRTLDGHVYIKDISQSVRKFILTSNIYQLLICSNERTEGIMLPITSTHNFEKVFLDICGSFLWGTKQHRYKFIIIILDRFTKYTKLFSINLGTTRMIIDIIINRYIPELGNPKNIITDHGTRFKGRR